MSEEVVVKGLPELKANLEKLPRLLARTALRKGVAAGAGVVRRAAKANSRVGKGLRRRGGRLVPGGTLKRSTIIKYVRKLSNDTQQVYLVTFRKGKREQKSGRDAYYAGWEEFGHRTRGGKGKSGAGFVQGWRMLTRAYNEEKYHAVEVIKDTIAAEIPKAVAQL